MQKLIFVVTVTRGTKTRYFYGEKLKEALEYAGLKRGDAFKYARFSRGQVQDGRWVRDGVYETAAAA